MGTTMIKEPLKLLLIEDSVDDADLTLRHLHGEGLTVEATRIDTRKQLQEAMATDWDAVLCDFSLPGWDGLDALKEIRATSPDLPFLFVSGTIGEGVAVTAMRSGANDYILKKDLRRLTPALIREIEARGFIRRAESSDKARLLSDARYESVVATAADAIITIDKDQLITSFNVGAENIFGYKSREVIGKPLENLIPNRLREMHHKHVSAFLASDVTQKPMNMRGDVYGLHASGSEFPAQASISKAGEGDEVVCTAILRDITDIKKAEDQIRFLAHYDPLTGLPNRFLFRERLQRAVEHAVRNRRFVGVLLLDLDRFKVVNDTRGHGVGDELLVAVGQRLVSALRSGDTVARLGGDEFGVILDDLAEPELAERLANTVLQTLRQPLATGAALIHTSGSIGVTISPLDGQEPQDLLANADLAMYRAKDAGGDEAVRFFESMSRRERERADLESDLLEGLQAGEFTVAYQPQVRIADGHTVRLEALARWQHHKRGNVPPNQFIHVAEDAGLINLLGMAVLVRCCQDAHLFKDRDGRQIKIAVNVSASQLRLPDFTNQFLSTIQQSGLAPSDFDVEITETVFADDDPHFRNAIREFEEAGVNLAIDDFGTGFSNLNRLRQLPVSTLKLDISLIRGLPGTKDERAIAEAAIAMSQRLGFESVAEGVETNAQLEILTDIGCDSVQGFLFSRPLPAAAIRNWVSHHDLAAQ